MQLNGLANLMKKNGIVGAGGAGFPSYAKLSDKPDTIILNCAECEPLLKLHRQMLAMFPYEIMTALDTVAKAVGAKKVLIAVKDSYKNTIEAVESNLSSFENMQICTLPNVYPSGDEIVLIYEITKKAVKAGNLPITQGIIVYNVETMLNLYYALKGKPVTHKFVTIAGEVKTPITLKVPIGTRISALIDMAGGTTYNNVTYINGGPMTGKTTSPYDVVTKTTNAILILKNNNVVITKKKSKTSISMKRAMSSCCQCQMCTDLCPRHLLGHPIAPHEFMRAASSGVVRSTDLMLDTMFCSGCGLCEMYSCPQGLNPCSLIEEYKTNLRKNGVKMPQAADKAPDENRKYRKVSMPRLVARLGLNKYNVPAPIVNTSVNSKEVKIMLSQHIGAPCKPIVSANDNVTTGQIIATVGDGLGADIHSSINGVIREINDKFIVVKENNNG